MQCSKCGNPLRIIKGGNKSDYNTQKITMVHVWGCLNPECGKKMVEVTRTETIEESFEG